MEMIKAALVALAMSVTPAIAQECQEAIPQLEKLQASGYIITFADVSIEWKLFMAENGKGGWVMFAVKDRSLCIVAYGKAGLYKPMPTNL